MFINSIATKGFRSVSSIIITLGAVGSLIATGAVRLDILPNTVGSDSDGVPYVEVPTMRKISAVRLLRCSLEN